MCVKALDAVAGVAHVQASFAKARETWDGGRRPMSLDQLERLSKTLEKFHAIGRAALPAGGQRGLI